MEIKKNKLFRNKTSEYVAFILKEYDKELVSKLNNLYKLGIGIGDMLMPDNMYNNHLFILVDTDKNSKLFTDTYKWLIENDYIVFDYPYDNIVDGTLHMIVIPIPDKYKKSLTAFKEGKYSKMFTLKELNELLLPNDKRLGVFTRSNLALKEFAKHIKKEYDVEIRISTWKGEAEYPIVLENEYFNYKIKHNE
jgi:hypothetical protein